MKKTIYIPKGDSGSYESLVCENLVVNGYLKVTGGITAKRISGSGVIRANVIKADTVVSRDITAGYIVVDELIAKRVSAVSVTAAQSLTVSCHLEAGFVKTQRAIIAVADVEDMQTGEIEKLSPKRHSLFGALMISAAKSLLFTLLFALKGLFVRLAEKSTMTGEVYDAIIEEPADKPVIKTVSNAEEKPDGVYSPDSPEYRLFLEICENLKRNIHDPVAPPENYDPPEHGRKHQFTAAKPELQDAA